MWIEKLHKKKPKKRRGKNKNDWEIKMFIYSKINRE